MANKKITDLGSKPTANATDVVPIVDLADNTTKRTTVAGLAAGIASSFAAGAIDGTKLTNGTVASSKISSGPSSTITDANGWLVKDYGTFKIATKSTSASESKVRFETATRSSGNLPVGVATVGDIAFYTMSIEAGTFSDFVSLTRQSSSSGATSLQQVYMYLGPTSATSYTVPIKFVVAW